MTRRNVVALLAMSFLSACAADPGDPGLHEFVVEHGGIERSFHVYVPASYDAASPAPAVLAFHGGGGTAEAFMDQTLLSGTAERYGFLAVYPQGTGPTILGALLGTWNSGECCTYAMENGIDDVGFVAATLDVLERTYAVDASRIYATGHSNGGTFAQRLGCELGDRIAAVASVGSHDAFKDCHPTRPVPLLHLHGTADPAAPYGGGVCGGLFARTIGAAVTDADTWECSSAEDFVAAWARRNGCRTTPVETLAQGSARCSAFTGCRADATVELCAIEGMGHTWPGGEYGTELKMFRDAVGPLNDDLSANERMWQFFMDHPLP